MPSRTIFLRRLIRARRLAAMAACILLAVPALSQTFEEKFLAPDREPFDSFGETIDLYGPTAIITAPGDDDLGSNAGSAYVFEAIGPRWTMLAKLHAPDGREGDHFGQLGAAIDGATIMVGATGEDSQAQDGGAVYVYQRNGSAWSFAQKLTAPDAGQRNLYGFSIDIEGEWAAVGAPRNRSARGAVYLYREGPSGWEFFDKLTASDESSDSQFGTHVGIDGETLVVGAPYHDGSNVDSGAAYVFRWAAGSWAEETKLEAPGARGGTSFGWKVSIDADWILVGAPTADGGSPSTGAAYVYRRVAGEWGFSSTLLPDTTSRDAFFGGRVALDGSRALVSAYFDSRSGPASGAAFLFERDGDDWTQVATLVPEDLGPSHQFGLDLAMEGSRLLVAAYRGDDEDRQQAVGAVYSYRVSVASEPPICDAGGEVILPCDKSPDCSFGGGPGHEIHFDGSNSFDPDGGAVTHSWSFSCGPLAFGGPSTPTATQCLPLVCGEFCFGVLNVTDDEGDSARCFAPVSIEDDGPPELVVPDGLVVECGSDTSPARTGEATATDDCPGLLAPTYRDEIVPGGCPGNFTIRRTWAVSDACGHRVEDVQIIEVRDTTPPEVAALTPFTEELWSPNHKLACLSESRVQVEFRDACSEPVQWGLSGCDSNQPDDGLGDGHTSRDCAVDAVAREVCARAERAGVSLGSRRYRVTVQAEDACGNRTGPVDVGAMEVRHDRRRE